MNDTEILSLYLSREESAIQRTAEKYGAYLQTTAYNILRSREDAEEAVDDTYFAAWNAIPPEIPKVLKHFLSRITRNIAFDRLDYLTAKRRDNHMILLLSELDACIADPGSSVESAWERKQLRVVLNQFLAGLAPMDCAIFLCRYFYCMPLAQIGEKYDLSDRTVKYRLSRARISLRKLLDKEGITL